MTQVVDTLLQGLLLGGLYALFAAGLSLTFGIMRLVNIAHGDVIVLGAYTALVAVDTLGVAPFASFVVVVPLLAGIGYLLQRGLINPVLGAAPLPPLLVTFGLSVMVQNLLLEVFSADTRGIDVGRWRVASVELGAGIAVGWLPLLVLVAAVAVIGGLELLFARTALGRAFRATSDDPTVARLMGIDTGRLFALATALAFAVTAVAGIFLALRTSFTPTMGPSRLLFAFEAVIIGGMGSLWGTLVGGILLGVAQAVGFRYDTGLGILAGHIAFLMVLLLHPQGLFARTRDA